MQIECLVRSAVCMAAARQAWDMARMQALRVHLHVFDHIHLPQSSCHSPVFSHPVVLQTDVHAICIRYQEVC